MPATPHTISGKVYDIYGNSLSGASISLTHSITPVLLTSTDLNGNYVLNLGNLSSQWHIGDSFTLFASKEAEGEKTQTSTISSGGGQTENITLEEVSDFEFERHGQNNYVMDMVIPLHYDGKKITRQRPFPVTVLSNNGNQLYLLRKRQNLAGSSGTGADGDSGRVFNLAETSTVEISEVFLDGALLVEATNYTIDNIAKTITVINNVFDSQTMSVFYYV